MLRKFHILPCSVYVLLIILPMNGNHSPNHCSKLVFVMMIQSVVCDVGIQILSLCWIKIQKAVLSLKMLPDSIPGNSM